MRGVCGRQRHNPHNAASISHNDGGGSESCGEKCGFGAAETFVIKTFAKSPAGHSGKRLLQPDPIVPKSPDAPADSINCRTPPRQPAHAARRKHRKGRTRFFPPREGLHRRPKEPRRHQGRNHFSTGLRARRKAAGAAYPLHASGKRSDIRQNHIRARPKARRFAGRDRPEIEAARKYGKNWGAGTGQTAQTATANDAGNPLTAQNLSAGARRIAVFSRSVPRAGGQKLI